MSRKLTYLTLAVTTWYLAGMYRSPPLTVLFLSEVGIFVLLALQSLYFHITLSAGFPAEWSVGEKGRDCRCRFYLHQKGILPVGRVRLTLRLSYWNGRRKTVRNIYGGVEGRSRTELEFFITPPCCGPLSVELLRVRVYDYLALFSSGWKSRQRMTLAVFPVPRPLRIVRAGRGFPGGLAGNAPSAVETPPEVRELREYRPGDSARAIHWKQSARTDRLWSREYEAEAGERFSLTLDLSAEMPPEGWDAFYEVLSALLLGLLAHTAAVRVFWRDGEHWKRWEVAGETDRQELFLRLYQADPPPPADAVRDRSAETRPLPPAPDGFALDTALNWRRGAEWIYQFSPSAFSEEIEQGVFSIP